MANVTDRQIVLDGPRNAAVKLTGVIDTTDIYERPAVSLLDFQNNERQYGKLVGLRVDTVEYSIGGGIELLLEWNSANPQEIFPLAGRGKINGAFHAGWAPNRLLAGYDGGINLKSSGYMTGKQNFSVTIEMVKLYA
jgi:hypothetical protein